MSKKGDARAGPEPSAVRALQLKVTLKYIEPPVWRRIVVANSFTLGYLHWVIQKAMGWGNDHLHAFSIGKVEYACFETAQYHGVLCDEDFFLYQVIKRRGQRFTYEYDFGDGWMHELLVEKMEPAENELPAPRCLDGARACPPEDCGGVGGYAAFLRAKGDPSKKNLELWGEPAWVLQFDPERFELAAVNERLQPGQKI